METYIGLILSGLLNIISLVLIGRYRVQKKEKDVTDPSDGGRRRRQRHD